MPILVQDFAREINVAQKTTARDEEHEKLDGVFQGKEIDQGFSRSTQGWIERGRGNGCAVRQHGRQRRRGLDGEGGFGVGSGQHFCYADAACGGLFAEDGDSAVH
jgi:hypothetical protein